jgi:hypothetical protein
MIKLSDLGQFNTLPCIDVYKTPRREASYKAVFLKSTIWDASEVDNKITITFGANGCEGCSTNAAWSFVGSQSNVVIPSMNLGFIDPPLMDFTIDGYTFKYAEFRNAIRNYCNSTSCVAGWKPGRTVLHEFGHAMGMLHEHQNYVAGGNPFQFDKQKVVEYYESIGYTASEASQLAQVNVIDRYECTSTNCPYAGSQFDKESIMIYPIDKNWLVPGTLNDWVNIPTFEYSSKDKEWLSKMYPKNSSSQPVITVEFLDGADWQKYWVKKMVMEGLSPYVGTKFEFPQLVGGSSTPVTTAPKASNKSAIIGAVIGGVLLFLFILVLLFS